MRLALAALALVAASGVQAHDPYMSARSMAGANCCHGTDCEEYTGEAPVPVIRDGKPGRLFANKWFFLDSQRIDPRTLPEGVRGLPHLCIGKGGVSDVPRCYSWPESG